MPADIQSILLTFWGYKSFRPLQEEIINSVLGGNDTLALLPTGGGKSLCYQVPALAIDGLCLVITPLIALMKDQVENLRQRGINAVAVYSGMSYKEIDIALDNAAYGNIKFLYLSPERLETDIFRQRATKLKVKIIAVDEAHCISEWGYDFRPSYLKIASVRELFPNAPIIALTASATLPVQNDIREKLEFRTGANIFTQSFDRSNLVYAVLEEEDKQGRLLKLLRKVPGTALIYVYTRKTAQTLALFLQSEGVSSDFYHAGLDNELRSRKQLQWKSGQIRAMVCTNAFGMGIDKSDVRLVVHYDLPDSLEAYYQEAGRAGRDLKRSFAVAMTTSNDRKELQRRADLATFTPDEMRQVYHALGNYFQLPEGSGNGESYNFDLVDFARKYALNPVKTLNVLKALEGADYIDLSEEVFQPSRIIITVDNQTIYSFEIANKRFEPLIKMLLRSYGGCFENYVSIQETAMAKRLNSTTRQVVEQLKELQQQKLVDYLPQNHAPKITFLTERLRSTHLQVDHRKLEEREHIRSQKLEGIFRYMFDHDRCRSRTILNYFGEKTDKDCGHCDYCLKNNRLIQEKDLLKGIEQKVKILLEGRSMPMDEFLLALGPHHEKAVREKIRQLIDMKIILRKGNLLELPS